MSTVCPCHVTVLMPSGHGCRLCHVTVLMPSGRDVDCVSMSCDGVDAFRAWMSTACLCHVTVLMPSGCGCRLRVYVM